MKKITKVEKGIRCWFTGTFDKMVPVFVKDKGRCWFVVITDIIDEYGNYACKCAYFADIKAFKIIYLEHGDRIAFRARCTICQNFDEAMYGFVNPYDQKYYRLMNPTKVKLLSCPVQSITEQQQSCKIHIPIKSEVR